MTTFDRILLKCPYCGQIMNAYDLMSYTVHRSESWSDGKTEMGIPYNPQICVCASCTKILWKDDARIDKDGGYEPQQDFPDVKDIFDLEWRFDDDRDIKAIDFYNNLLDPSFCDTDTKEFYVRERLWWAINDLVRHLSTWRSIRNLGMMSGIINHRRKTNRLFRSYRKLFKGNLKRLAEIYVADPQVDMLYLANIYREAGLFKEAKESLEKVESKGKSWRRIRKKVRRRNTRVFKL